MNTKRSLVLLLAILASPLLAEGFLRLGTGYRQALAQGEIEVLVERVTGRASPAPTNQNRARVAHPFYGSEWQASTLPLDQSIAEHLQPGRYQRFHIWILGGSVASMFSGKSRGGLPTLRVLLKSLLAMQGRTIKFLPLALAGYKQPQQLGKLTYLLARGAVPDLVINLDGLNEMRGGMANFQAGQEIALPTPAHWSHLIGDFASRPRTLAALSELGRAREEFLDLARETLDS